MINSFFPEHERYIEPFCGAASVLLRKPVSDIEVVNDKHDRLINLLRVLRDPKKIEILEEKLVATPYSAIEYYDCREKSEDSIEDARRMIVLSHQGFGSTGVTGGKITGWRRSIRRKGYHGINEWNKISDHLPAWSHRLNNCYIDSKDAIDILKTWDHETALFYVDPPYLHDTRSTSMSDRGYKHEMTDEQHVELAEALSKLKGYVIVSGYPSDLYFDLYSGWECHRRQARADKAKKATECLWLSPKTSVANRTGIHTSF
ncbi:MAG: DNA adenine methylase [Candidatus Zixiibacteriota bacterium]|nr:MAG: DNA adenine methylase [candidate division Zixibacteria bacterium]